MSEPMFTPGEWKAHKQSETDWAHETWEIHYTDDGECVAEVIHSKADAYLMAASKDLYRVLQSLLSEQNGIPLLKRERQYSEAVKKAREALAKAEGRTP